MSLVKQGDLKLIVEKDKVFCDSRELASKFDKRHEQVLRKIDQEIRRFEKLAEHKKVLGEYFKEDTYKGKDGRTIKRYLLTFKGFQAIALQFAGQKAFENRIKFIEFFEKLITNIESDKLKAITNSKDLLWLEFREEGKDFRKKMTRAIRDTVVKYREEVEKKLNDGRYYMHYTKLIYKYLKIDLLKGAEPRDTLNKRMLVKLEDLEDKVADKIYEYSETMHYKDVFKQIKLDFETGKIFKP